MLHPRNDVPRLVGYTTDIEGDVDCWRRYVELSDVLSRGDDGLVELTDGAHFVYGGTFLWMMCARRQKCDGYEGDAVDRQAGDLEFLAELLALKRRYPSRVHLLYALPLSRHAD